VPYFLRSFSDQPTEQLTARAMQGTRDHFEVFAAPEEKPLLRSDV
jgi:hypothetical protein